MITNKNIEKPDIAKAFLLTPVQAVDELVATNAYLGKLATHFSSILAAPSEYAVTIGNSSNNHQVNIEHNQPYGSPFLKVAPKVKTKLYTAQAEALCHQLDISDPEAKDSSINSDFPPSKCPS